MATARLASDPTRDLRGALTFPTVTHYRAITDARKVGQLLRAIDDYEGSGITKLPLQIAPHVFVRPGELRHAEWSEVDLDDALWIIPAGKLKVRKAHHVPLSRQAVELFPEAYSATGPQGYVFPSVCTRARPMSENTINAGLRRLGYGADEMTAHGFRAMASTLLNESGKWNPDVIECALAHGDTDKVSKGVDLRFKLATENKARIYEATVAGIAGSLLPCAGPAHVSESSAARSSDRPRVIRRCLPLWRRRTNQ